MKTAVALLSLVLLPAALAAQEPSLRQEAARALRRGVDFFRGHVAVEGSYLWAYSEDLALREGEGVATSTRGWVQPPGTPSVGEALLTAYEATADPACLEAARHTASALLRGQLESGGWYYYIDFAPADRRRLAYREGGNKNARNVTTLDDDTTQAALRFLLRADQALEFRDDRLHEAVRYALDSLLKAQYPNGAWPQGYDRFPDPDHFPVQKASYPESWPRAWPGSRQYWLRYTLNDNVLADMVDTLLLAERICRDPRAGSAFHRLADQCRAAGLRAGDFLILAQMPEPQPAWAQQYDFDMHPAWARKFEPPAVTGGESQGVLRTLLQLYRDTGLAKYLEPVPRALNYFRSSRLPGERLARFYELRTNKPLYFTRDYALTYDDADVPTHYAFTVPDGTEAIAREYERLREPDSGQVVSSRDKPPAVDPALVAAVQEVIAAQDDQGRWVEGGGLRFHRPKDPGRRVIRCQTFINNLNTLSRYLTATRP